MCKKLKGCGRRIDPCMKRLIDFINTHPNIETIASCCGHGKYNMTIVIKEKTGMDGKWIWKTKELLSEMEISRKRRFYIKDKQGYYYIPETL